MTGASCIALTETRWCYWMYSPKPPGQHQNGFSMIAGGAWLDMTMLSDWERKR
jgi:hypothetical protein